MKIDQLNLHFFKSCIESLPKFPSYYLCFWRNTQKVLENVDVRNTWNKCVQWKKRSDKCCRPGTHHLEVETSCIKQVKGKLFNHHLAGLNNFAQKLKE